MTSRAHWKLLVLALITSGCQSTGSIMPSWFASNDPVYTSEELASLNNPQPLAARPELANGAVASNTNSQQIQTVSATTSGGPNSASRVEELVRIGQANIRAAGKDNPVKLQEARNVLGQALSLDSNSASANHSMAIVADLQKDWPTAEFHYKQALRSRPQDPSLLNDIGYSYLLQNRFHEATQYLNQALQFAPQHERAHVNLALLSLKRGDRAGAQSRLSGIYSPADVQTTLTKLDQDLLESGGQPAAVAAANTAYNAAPQYPPNHQGSGQFGSVQTIPLASNNATNRVQANQTNQPIHVYPPGVELSPEPTEVTTNQQIYPPQAGVNGQPMTIQQYGVPGAPQPMLNTQQQYNNPSNNGLSIPQQPNQFGTVQYSNPQPTYGPPIHSATQNETIQPQGLLQQMTPQQPASSARYPNVGTSAGLNAPLAGLNAGPGALFPISATPPQPANSGAPAPQQNYGTQYPPNQQPHQAPNGTNPTLNVPTPGNVISYPAGTNALPAEQHMRQMQMMNSPTVPQQNYQSSATPVSSTNYPAPNNNAYNVSPQGMVPQQFQNQYQTAATPQHATPYVTSPQPTASGQQPRMNSPLAAYEQQLQNLDNQYNRTLQQMDGTGNGLAPVQGQYR